MSWRVRRSSAVVALVALSAISALAFSSTSCWSAPATLPETASKASVGVFEEPSTSQSSFRAASPQRHESRSSWWSGATAFSFLAALVLAFASPQTALAKDVEVYFGQGCFWHVQHMFAEKELEDLSRATKTLTAVSGYAGGETKKVCYHNREGAPDYGKLGHTEVVNVSIPEEKVQSFAKFYFDSATASPFGRNDPQDLGGEYRSAIGLPGGVESPLYEQVKAANKDRVKLVAGAGGDPDTLMKNTVYVYDSDKFPFVQGEAYHQFHDDMREKYSDQYKRMKAVFKMDGRLKPTNAACPDEQFS